MNQIANRLVLKPDVAESDFELLCWEQNWLIVEMGEEEAGAHVDIWRTGDGATEIHYVRDLPIGLVYVTLRGDGVDVVERRIRERLHVWSLPEALDTLRDAADPEQKRASVYVIALTATSEQEREVIEAMGAIARDSDPTLRRSFVEAVGYVPWPALLRLVEELRDTDPAPEVRRDASVLMDGLRLHGPDQRPGP